MEADFERAERRLERERKEAERKRKLREEQEARVRRIAEEAEKKRETLLEHARELERRRKEREEEEALQSGGVRFERYYRPVPLANLESDKIKLPPTALEELSSQGALESARILAFELSLMDDAKSDIVGKTYCGVSDFTAAEGTIQMPIKTVLSLTKEVGESALVRYRVRVRYVAIERYAKVRVRVQPLGEGFHKNGTEEVNTDLRSLLGRVLSQQTVLSEGDLVPVRHQGETYILAIREIWPDSQVILVNTDVEIDMMPSEVTENALRSREEEELKRKRRAEQAKQLLESLPPEPIQGGLAIRARLPEGATASRKFAPDTPLQIVFNWAYAVLGDKGRESDKLEMVQTFLPGQSKVYTIEEHGAATLKDAGFQRVENLNFRWTAPRIPLHPPEAQNAENERTKEYHLPSEWSSVKASAEQSLDNNAVLQASENVMEVESENEVGSDGLSNTEMFTLLTLKGADPRQAAQVIHKYLPCLQTIHRLGLLEYENIGRDVMELVEKFKGSAGRVADGLVEKIQAAEKTATSQQEKWAEQMAILQSMFENRKQEEILAALSKHNGVVQLAVNELLLS